MELTVRVIKTYHVAVSADFGDTTESLLAKGLAGLDPAADPDDIHAVLMPQGAVL